MKFYRVKLYDAADGSMGFVWFSSRREADKEAVSFNKEVGPDRRQPEATVEVVEIGPTKRAVLAALNTYATHPDNG